MTETSTARVARLASQRHGEIVTSDSTDSTDQDRSHPSSTASHGANRRATAPGSRHHGWLMPPPRLPDAHTNKQSISGQPARMAL